MSVKTALRVGLLIDSFIQPQWVQKIIADIQSSSIAEVVLVIKNDEAGGSDGAGHKQTFFQKVSSHKEDLLYIAYSKLDRTLFKVDHDAFEHVSIESLVSDCPILEVKPRRTKSCDYLQDHEIAAIREYKLDVALRFGFRILKGPVLETAKYGVWSYHHGDNLVNRGGPSGFWEVMEGNPITGSVLQILSEKLDAGKVIYRSYAATDKYSVNRNKNNFYWKTSDFVIRKLRELYESGPDALNGDPFASVYWPYSNRLYKAPTNAEMLRLLFRVGKNYVSAKLQMALYHHQWFLAYRLGQSNGVDSTFYRFKHFIPPKDRFWADPFPVKKGDKFFIFIEEFMYKDRKGHISVIEMDEQGNHKEPVRVLERDYHLSYPFIFAWQDNYYMIPETADNKTIELYRCTSFPLKWELEKVLMTNVNAADATLVEMDGRWWMFVNIAVDGASKDDELHLFYADNPLGPWQPHQHNPVKSDVRSSRPAGRVFQWNGHFYRPAQDCSETYGYAISMNKIVHLDPDRFFEIEVSKVLPKWKKNMIGTHMLNHTDQLTVIDGVVRKRKYF